LGGQVFIQVNFNTADDYQIDGLLDVSDALQFYETDRVAKAGIKGIVYRVTHVDSTFSSGKFSQTLDLLMVPESELLGIKKTESQEAQAQQRVETNQANQTAATQQRTGVNLNSTAGAGRGNRGGPTADELAAYRNTREAQKPQSSYAKGVQETLNPPTSVPNPSLTQLTKSQAYISALGSGVGPRRALDIAKAALTGIQTPDP
jgi:hypothetical protein